MAGRRFTVPFGGADSLVATGTATKTIVQVEAGANHALKILGFRIFGDSVDLDAVPVPAELLVQTTAGTMSAVTEGGTDTSAADTIDATGLHTATAEPTASTVLWPFQYAPSAGYAETFGPGDEIIVGAADRVGLRVLTPAVDHNVNGLLYCEE